MRAEAVVLPVVPALVDDAMESHELGVHRDADEADRVKEFLAQWNELVKAVLAAVITVREYVGMGSRTVGGVGGAGGGPAIVAASRIVGARAISSCPPITRSVVAMSCARAGGGGIFGGSRVRMIGRGHSRSREASGLRVRPDDPGQSGRGSVVRQGFQTCTGQGRRGWYRNSVDQAPSGMRDCVDHGVPFCRKFCSGGAKGGIESVDAGGSGSGNSGLKVSFGRRPSRVEGRSKVGLS